MRTPNWTPKTIHANSDFTFVMSFEPEFMDAKKHFIDECGWSLEQYQEINPFYWFTAKISSYKNGVHIDDQYLGGCCYSSLNDVMQDGKLKNILGGYAADMVRELQTESLKALDLMIANNQSHLDNLTNRNS